MMKWTEEQFSRWKKQKNGYETDRTILRWTEEQLWNGQKDSSVDEMDRRTVMTWTEKQFSWWNVQKLHELSAFKTGTWKGWPMSIIRNLLPKTDPLMKYREWDIPVNTCLNSLADTITIHHTSIIHASINNMAHKHMCSHGTQNVQTCRHATYVPQTRLTCLT